MLNSVETFKEKLRATLSEPNSSSDRSKRNPSGKIDDRRSEGLTKTRSAGNSRRPSSSVSSGSQRRARWIRDTILNHAPSIHGEEGKDNNVPFEKSDSGFHEQNQDNLGSPQLFEVNESIPNLLQRGPNNNDALNYK